MEISNEGKDILANIDEALSDEYECFQMLMAFDKGDGPKNNAAKDIIRVLKKTEGLVNEFVDNLSIYDTTSLLEGIIGISEGNFEYGISYSVSKEKMVITRTINELLSKYLKEQTKEGSFPYYLVLKQYLTVDFINLMNSILNRMSQRFDEDIQKQIIIVKYQLIYCMTEVVDSSLQNSFVNGNKPLIIHRAVQSFCNVSEKEFNEFINTWALGMFFNALKGIINNKSDSISIVDIVNCATMRSLILLLDEEFASELMHDTLNYLRTGKIPSFDEELLFESVTSRFEDEEMPQFLSFIR